MQTRVRPRNTIYSWEVHIMDPDTNQWIEISKHHFFGAANWKAHRLSKKSLAVKMHKKEEFLNRLKGTHKDPNKGVM